MFQLSTKADVADVKIIRGTSDDAAPRVDIRFKVCDVSAEAVAAALGADSADDVAHGLFRSLSQDAEQNSRFLNLASIKSKATWEARHRLTIEGFRPTRCSKVGKIAVLPRGKCRSDITFTASIEKPTRGFLDALSELLHHETLITLDQEAELELKGGQVGTPAPKSPQQGVIDLPRAGRKPVVMVLDKAKASKEARNKRDRDRRAEKSAKKSKPGKRKAA
jgi:hypothetical protein